MSEPADRRMLEALVCPVTNAVLTYDAETAGADLQGRPPRLPDPRRHPDHAGQRSPQAGLSLAKGLTFRYQPTNEHGAGCNSRLALPAADPPDHRQTDHHTHDRGPRRIGLERILHDLSLAYRNQWFGNIRGDLLSGLVVALALIPEAIAFSIIAGVDPKVGLYASFSIAVITAIAGGGRA
jgi:uncharacterized protein YbaR (Trm112 family)